MATYVLVHGLGLGGWCWIRVADRLRSQGHEVLTPTHTGLGERSHLATPDVTLDTHITDIENTLVWNDLDEVILVGHSYGGAVVTGAADRAPERLKHLVYLDAFILEDGQSIMSLQPPHRVEFYENLVEAQGDGWRLPPNSAEFYGVTDPADQAWLDGLQVPQPFGTFTQPLRLTQTVPPPYARTYIWAEDFPQGPFGQFAERVQDDPNWSFHTLKGAHMLMVTSPGGVARLLHSLA